MSVRSVLSRSVPLVLLLAGLALYGQGLRSRYYGDDYQFVFDRDPSASLSGFFTHGTERNDFYRPLQASFLWLVQRPVGLETLPIHLVQVLMHGLLAWLVFHAMLRLAFTPAQAALGSLLLLVSQANVHAVLSNDTFSQVASTLFGYLSVWLAYEASGDGRRAGPQGTPGPLLFSASALCLGLSMLSKESGVGFLPVVAFVGWQARAARERVELGALARWIAPFLLVAIAYFVVRSLVLESQPKLGAGGYDFRIGGNIVKNLAMFAFAVALPVSSVTAFAAITVGPPQLVLLCLAATGLFVLAVLLGLWTARARLGVIAFVVLVAVCSLLPMVALNHVSELYVYNAMPAVAAIYGVALGSLLEKWRRGFLRVVAVGGMALLVASHVVAVQDKASRMRQCGERSDALLAQLVPSAAEAPAGASLCLLQPSPPQLEYSIFLMPGFRVLENGLHRIGELAQREDLRVEILDSPPAAPTSPGSECLVLTLEEPGERIVPAKPLLRALRR